MLSRYVLFIVGVASSLAGPLRAEDPLGSAREVISRQITAFARGDAIGAFSEAGPDMRNGIADGTRFLAMARERYAPLDGVRNFAFGRSKLVGGGEFILQEVMLTSRDGSDWTAIFEIRLLDSGAYKVNEIRLRPNGANRGI